MKTLLTLIFALISLSTNAQFLGRVQDRWSCTLGSGSCNGPINDFDTRCYFVDYIGESTISFALAPLLAEIKVQPKDYRAIEGYDVYEVSDESFFASWDAGEHWISAESTDGYNYQGVLTLDQDNEMAVTCKRDLIFLEPSVKVRN